MVATVALLRPRVEATMVTMHQRLKRSARQLPVLVEHDEDGYYVVECPLFSGCYTQGRTLDEALKNLREVIELCLEEPTNRERLDSYQPAELAFHTLSYA